MEQGGHSSSEGMEVDVNPPELGSGEGEAADGEQDAGKRVPSMTWQLRVCPIMFEDFCNQRKEFTSIIKLCTFCEFRMSQHLSSKPDPSFWAQSQDKDVPWLPNEKIFTKPQNAATAGMLELKMKDENLVPVVRIIRSLTMVKRVRLRFELQRLLPIKDKRSQEGEATAQDSAQTEGEVEMEGEGTEGETTEGEARSDLMVNFGVRLQPVRMPAFSHEEGYVLKAEDKQIFLDKVPDDVPDSVLEAIMLSELVSRETSEDGNGRAVFTTFSPLGAQGYMELFDGILVNNKLIDMATTLGTLYDARKKHTGKQEENREANEKQIQALKRKTDEALPEAHEAKKPRAELMPHVARMWLKSKEAARGAARSLRSVPLRRPTLRRPVGRGVGGRPFSSMRGRGGERGRGVGAPRGRGGGGESGGKVFVRGGGGRGRPTRGKGRPGRGAYQGVGGGRGGGGGYHGGEEVEAQLMATERELHMTRGRPRMPRRGRPFGARGAYGYDDRLDFASQRRKW